MKSEAESRPPRPFCDSMTPSQIGPPWFWFEKSMSDRTSLLVGLDCYMNSLALTQELGSPTSEVP